MTDLGFAGFQLGVSGHGGHSGALEALGSNVPGGLTAVIAILGTLAGLFLILQSLSEGAFSRSYRRSGYLVILSSSAAWLAVLDPEHAASVYLPGLLLLSFVYISVIAHLAGQTKKHVAASAMLRGILNDLMYTEYVFKDPTAPRLPDDVTDSRDIAPLLRRMLRRSIQIVSLFCLDRGRMNASVMLLEQAERKEDSYLYIYAHEGLSAETERLFRLYPYRSEGCGIAGIALSRCTMVIGNPGDREFQRNPYSAEDDRSVGSVFSIPLTYKRRRDENGASSEYKVIGVLNFTTAWEVNWGNVDKNLLYTIAGVITTALVLHWRAIGRHPVWEVVLTGATES